MAQSMVIVEDIIEKNLNGIILKVLILPNKITLTYTNEKYQTFQKEITDQTYQQTIGKFSVFFPKIPIFSKLIKKESSSMNLKTETDLIILFINPFTEEDCEITIKLQKRKETEVDLLNKQIRELKTQLQDKNTELSNFEENRKKMIEEMKEAHQKEKSELASKHSAQIVTIRQQNEKTVELLKAQMLKTIEELKQKNQEIGVELQQTKKDCRKKLQRIHNEGRKHKPMKRQKLLEQQQNFNKISLLALPMSFRDKLYQFKRIYLHEPKYILSVFGVANAGKSTFLSQLMENPEEKHIEHEREVKPEQMHLKENEKDVFPQNDNPLTFYDTFYCYNQSSQHIEIAMDINPKDLIFKEIFQEDGSEMTLLCEDKLHYETPKQINLTKIQQIARANLSTIQSLSEKMKRFQNKYLILRYNRNIFHDKFNKYDYLNKYVVLMDRAGIDDGIFDLNSQQKIQLQKNELKRIKNQTVFYCVPGQQLMTADNVAKDHMLNLLNTHDFQKIILCVNCIGRFGGDAQYKRQLERLGSFFIEMFQAIPDHMKKLLVAKIKSMEDRSKEIQNTINKNSKDNTNTEQQKRLYVEDRKLRLQINKFKDELKKYEKICEKMFKFSQEIKPKIQYGITKELQQKIKEMIKVYPLQNICFFGLEKYAKKFEVISFLKRLSQDQFKKHVGSQSLYSVQKFYYNKLQSLNEYHSSLEKYYTHLPIVMKQIQLLNREEESKTIEKRKSELLRVGQQILNLYSTIVQKLKKQKQYVEENRNKNLKVLIVKGEESWENLLQRVITQCIYQSNERVTTIITQYKTSLTDYKKSLISRIKQKSDATRFSLLEDSVKYIVNLTCQDLETLCEDSLLPLVIIWNKMIASATEHLNMFLKNMKDSTKESLKLPHYLVKIGKFYQYKFKEQRQNSKKQWTFFSSLKNIMEDKFDEKNEEYVKRALSSITLYLNDSAQIRLELSEKITEITNLAKAKESTLLILLEKKLQQATNNDKKIVEDVILEMKGEYLQKLRRINYDMVLNGVNKFDQYEEEKKNGWIE